MNTNSIYSVTQITNQLNYSLEKKFSQIFIKGEVSSFRLYDSGHAYFTLKDKNSILNCVYFNYADKASYLRIKENLEIVAFGTINIYRARGSIQLIVSSIHVGKEGELWQNYLKLKDKLSNEGLFDKSHKKELPYIPNHISIISSKEGAVIHDILNILYRRAPYLEVDIEHSLVQGVNAVNSVIKLIKKINNEQKKDLIIIARGGGSLEDLMPFNDELLVRAIFSSEIPIITAIGHESDFTLSDLVSDKRASTPSEAAEICAPNVYDLNKRITLFQDQFYSALNTYLKNKNNVINTSYLRISSKNPKLNIEFYNESLILNYKILKSNFFDKFSNYKSTLRKYSYTLQRYNIKHIKSRGFSLIKKDGMFLKNIKEIKVGDEIKIELNDGQVNAKINKIYDFKNKKQ